MSLSQLPELLAAFAGYIAATATKAFVSPGGAYGIASLTTALVVSAAFLLWRRQSPRRRLRARALVRALLPRRILAHASTRADLQYLLFNVFVFGLVFGWAILGGQVVAAHVRGTLVATLGPLAPSSLPDGLQMALMTLALFLAYEAAYWLDHFLAHRVPFLWEFHKVHHSAEVLTPLTNARVHPVDTIVFYNITALMMGLVGGLMQFALGKPVPEYSLWSNNAIALVFAYLVNHLQHSHMWIAFTGLWGKLLLSPAHHQIHHSTDPAHFDRNLGSSLAVFDWLFGTLHVPARKREKLTFGVDRFHGNPHAFADSLAGPVKVVAQRAAAFLAQPETSRAEP